MFVDAKLRVTFVVQGAAAAQGTLIYAFDPRPNDPVNGLSKVAYPQRTRSLLLPHVKIDPSLSTSYTLDLPAPTVWGKYSMSTSFEAGSYSMHQIVLNNLGSGTADSNEISISIYLSLVDPVFCSATTYSEFASSKEELTTKEGGIISSFFHKASEIAVPFSNIPIPFISEPATIFSEATGAIGKFFAWFGFSKPLTYDVTPTFIGVQNPFSKIDGRVVAQQMNLRSNNSVGISEDISPLLQLEDMVCSELMKKPGLCSVFTISNVASSGSVIRELSVTPSLNLALNSPAITNGYELTPMSFVAFPYRYWRGDITYHVDFVCSAFHRATVMILYDPRSTTSSMSAPISASSLLKHWTVSICGNTSIEFTIPWSQIHDYCPIGSPDIGHTSADCNGEIIFVVLNPVTTNGSTDPVHVNVYQSSSHMYLAEVSMSDSELPVFSELASGVSDPTFYAKYFGEEPAHTIKELASMGTFEVEFSGISSLLNNGASVFFTTDAAPTIKPSYTTTLTPGNVLQYLTLVDFLSMSYVGVRGSYITTIFPNGGGDGILSCVSKVQKGSKIGFSTVGANLTYQVGWSPIAVTSRRTATSSSIYQPYRHYGAFSVSGVLSGGKNERYMHTLYNADTSATSTQQFRVAVMKSAGEDFLFVGYRGTPVAVYPQFED